MKRWGAFILMVVIILCAAAGMWFYQSWKSGQDILQQKDWSNVYLVKKKGASLTLYAADGRHECRVKGDLKDKEYTGIGDVSVRFGRVEKLVCKPEQLKERVLLIAADSVELENYGRIPFDDHVTCFSLGKEIKVSSVEELYVGQTDAAFAVAGGKICSVLLPGGTEEVQMAEGETQTEEKTADKTKEKEKEVEIRVILKTDDFASYEHSEVKLRGTKKIIVKSGKEQREVQPGEEVVFTAESMKERRVSVRSAEDGKIEVCSLKRSGKSPIYRGTIEVEKTESGLHLINQLPLEEYLYGVLPSEMPAEYEKEALKAQAVCARSYAVKHIKNNRLKELGAHVDDSVSYQVYNNTGEDERCNRAVDETAGLKAFYDGKVVTTYFFSTACGVTTSAADVGFSEKEIPYLTGRLQDAGTVDADGRQRSRLVSETFGNEELFRKFLKEDRDVLEKGQPWYRWRTEISLGDIENNINTRIGARCAADGDKIQVRQADGTYVSQPVEGIGKLKRVRIKDRGDGGVVKMAVIVGTERTVRVYSEYNIRSLIFNENTIVSKNDGTAVSGLNMLPSGFFVLDKKGSTYEIRGGGFGHGTGLSQTGANELAKAGKGCEEIMAYYFDGVVLKK